MIKNHITSAIRSLKKNKGFAAINILGLAVGLTAVLLIALWVQYQYRYDNFHKNQSEIHKLWTGLSESGNAHDITSYPAAEALVKEFPEVTSAARVYWTTQTLLKVDNKDGVKVAGNEVDPTFLEVFEFPVREGQGKDALQDKSNLVITESLAKSLFGEEEAIGKTVLLDNENPYIVTAVLADLPAHTQFNFSFLIPLNKEPSNWNTFTYSTYVRTKKNVDLSKLNTKIATLLSNHAPDLKGMYNFLYPVSEQHLYSKFENGVAVGGKIQEVRLVAIIGLLILVVAGINFVNLSTARGQKRAKEVGVRKVIGARKGNLIGQFLTESMLICLFAGLLAIFLGILLLPIFNQLLNTRLTILGTGYFIWLALFAFVLLTGLTAGIYPAFVLSSFKPIKSLKGKITSSSSYFNMRSVLVVFQFSIAIILVISTLIIRLQIQHASNRNAGYDTAQLIEIALEGDANKNYELIKNELINSGMISSVARTGTTITQSGASSSGNFWWPGATPEQSQNTTFRVVRSQADIVETLGLKLIDGRDIQYPHLAADSNAILLNEAAIKMMALENPIGQIFKWGDADFKITGIVSDFIMGSPYEDVTPLIFYASQDWMFNMIVHTNGHHSTVDQLAQLEKTLKKYNPAYPFNYKFVSEGYAEKFRDQQQTASISSTFSLLAIFLSCLGLFGMIAYVIETKVKEIGVRKVLGASVSGIVGLLSKDFVKLVLLAIIIASPIAWWAMNKWLEDFAYRIDIQWWMFALAGVLAITVALLTISYQAIRAAVANPVNSLRDE